MTPIWLGAKAPLILKSIKNFFLSIPVWVYAALLLLGLHWYGVWAAYHDGRTEERAVWEAAAKVEKARSDAALAATNLTIAREAAAIRASLTAALETTDDTTDRILDDLRTGVKRLRPRLTCPTVPTGPGAATGGDSATPAAGFTEADAAVAFGIARDGDKLGDQLNACIKQYNDYRQTVIDFNETIGK